MTKQKSQSETSGTKPASDNEQNAAVSQGGQDAVTLLTQDHRDVETLFQKYEAATADTEKLQLARQVCKQLIIHTLLEEEIFYPACQTAGVDDNVMKEAQVEHDAAKVLIADLLSGSPSDDFYDAKVGVLSEYIKHHVGEEEADDGIFAKAQQAELDMNALGQRLQARKTELTTTFDVATLAAPRPHSLKLDALQENPMSAPGNERERDEYGRFLPDDHRGGRRSASRRDEYDDDRNDNGRRGGGRDYSSRSRDYDDRDSRRSGGEGRGWYGDPEGHSRASERGWEERGGGRGGYSSRKRDEGEDDRYSRRSGGEGRGWDERGGGRGGYSSRGRDEGEDDRYSRRSSGEGLGWHGDSEGHSRASERGWEERGQSRGNYDRGYSARDRDDDHFSRRSGGEGRGWYGDSEGHSRAAEKGWDERGHESGRGSPRGRDDERDNGGRGGWFGDSRGHSEAARRGWENR